MKKLGAFLAGVGLLAGVTVAADSNTATSVNAVGFVKVTVPSYPNFVAVAFNFEGIGGFPASVQEIIGTNVLRRNGLFTKADKLQIYDAQNQRWIQYFQKTDGLFYITTNTSVAVSPPMLNPGQGFFISPPVTATNTTLDVAVSGEVVTSNIYTQQIVQGLQLFTSPFASDFNIYSNNWVADGARANALFSKADRIYVWNGATWDQFFLKSTGWYYVSNPSVQVTNGVIPVGGGAWYQARTNYTLTIDKPYSFPL